MTKSIIPTKLRQFSLTTMPGKRKADDEAGADKKPKGDKKNKCVTEWTDVVWDSDAKTGDGKPWNLKICSWNVDGLRACVTKGGAEYLEHEQPDVMCFQETKVSQKKLPDEMKEIAGYPHCYWLAAEKDGYSGVG